MNCPRCTAAFPVFRTRSLPSPEPEQGRLKICPECDYVGVVGPSGRLARLKQRHDFPETRRRDVGLTTFDLDVYACLLSLAMRQNLTFDPDELRKPKPLSLWLTRTFPVDLFPPEIFPARASTRAKRQALLKAVGLLERAGAIRRFRGEVHEGEKRPPAWRFMFPGYRRRVG